MKFLFLFLLPFGLSSQSIIDTAIVKYEKLIYFDSNVYELGDEGTEAIEDLVTHIGEFDEYEFYVDAHTDDVGSNEFNLKLSANRKQSVVDLLKKYGVPDSLITSNFHGEALPVAMSQDASSRQINRRAIVQLLINKKLILINGIILDDSTKVAIVGNVELRSKEFSAKTKTDTKGQYSILAPLDEHVVLEFTAKDYFFDLKKIKVTRALIDKVISVPLVKIEIGKKFEFKDMFFEGSQAVMLERSKPVLNQMKKFMFVNDEVCVEIEGHVNYPDLPKSLAGSFEQELSIARSLVIQEALVSVGVGSDRLLSRGYGNWFMVYPHAKSEKHQEKNRRVEIVISDCDSTRLILDQTVVDRSLYMEQGIDKLYNEFTQEEDTKDLSIQALADLILQLRNMELAGIDAAKYTYKEMLVAFPDLP